MQISDLLTAEHIACDADTQSKKRVLERLSALLITDVPGLSAADVFACLVERERLGSTGLGQGVAIPHGRLKGNDRALAAFIKLDRGVDFDAGDKQPVDLLFALLVPENSTSEHLEILSMLAAMFSDKAFVKQLRSARNSAGIFDLLTHWQPHPTPA